MGNIKKSEWYGFKREDFTVFNTSATVVKPDESKKGNPFVFRAEFFGAFAYADVELLKRGYHVAYIDTHDMYGCEQAIDVQHGFHLYLMENYGLARKCAMFGFSRGGLYAVNYAAKYPDFVGVLYLDAPVTNILSWPGGMGSGEGAPECFEQCLELYGITRGEALSFRGNPVDKVKIIADSKIPVISVVGCVDTVVPYDENMKIFAKRFLDLGGEIKVIEKQNCGHHPHSLEDPTEICDFIIEKDRQL